MSTTRPCNFAGPLGARSSSKCGAFGGANDGKSLSPLVQCAFHQPTRSASATSAGTSRVMRFTEWSGHSKCRAAAARTPRCARRQLLLHCRAFNRRAGAEPAVPARPPSPRNMLVRLRKDLSRTDLEAVLSACRRMGYRTRRLDEAGELLELQGEGAPQHRS